MLHFRPQLFWQELLPEHVCDPGLEFRMDMGSGKNAARFPHDNIPLPDDLIKRETRIVSDKEGRDDVFRVAKKLKSLASWGDSDAVAHVLRSCYVTRHAADPAMCEAASLGFAHVLETLLKAGANPHAETDGKTALHWACQNGHEGCAKLLIISMNNEADIMSVDPHGLTAFDYLHQNDMEKMATRLEEFVQFKLHVNTFLRGRSPLLQTSDSSVVFQDQHEQQHYHIRHSHHKHPHNHHHHHDQPSNHHHKSHKNA